MASCCSPLAIMETSCVWELSFGALAEVTSLTFAVFPLSALKQMDVSWFPVVLQFEQASFAFVACSPHLNIFLHRL